MTTACSHFIFFFYLGVLHHRAVWGPRATLLSIGVHALLAWYSLHVICQCQIKLFKALEKEYPRTPKSLNHGSKKEGQAFRFEQ